MRVTREQVKELSGLIDSLRDLYGQLRENLSDDERRSKVWTDIRDKQQRIEAVMPPAVEPLS